MERATFLFGAVVVSGLVGAGCQTISEELPSQPNPAPSTPVVRIEIPVILPTPKPTPVPTPTPQPQPDPDPSPMPTGGPVRVYCSPAIPPDGYPCPKSDNPRFDQAVASAITKLRQQRPSLFDGYDVLDVTAYYNGVFENLYQAGYCAIEDSEEVAVSTRDDPYYRENYRIITSTGKYRTGPGSHQSACQLPRP